MERASEAAQPISLSEIEPIFDRLLEGPLALAVSGGADSMALIHLVATWLAARQPRDAIIVFTVDHALRSGSAEEAVFVAAEAAKLGLAHRTLVWRDAKPRTGIQAAARVARYRLLAEACGGAKIVTAHHRDDVAETLLLRLARGSGIRGLAAMKERGAWPLAPTSSNLGRRAFPELVRPLLGFEKARLVATLVDLRATWIEDPSNENEDFERVRLRHAGDKLAALGLTNERLAQSAQRLARASDAIERITSSKAQACVALNDGAFISIDLNSLTDAPEEVAVRLLERALAASGGQEEPASLSQVEALCGQLCLCGDTMTRTLAGCIIEAGPAWQGADGREVRIFRETVRAEPPLVEMAPGTTIWWDRRFTLTVGGALEHGVTVKMLGESEWRSLVARYPLLAQRLPSRAAAALPSFWHAGTLVGVPHVARQVPVLAGPVADGQALLEATFTNAPTILGCDC
jgi:tRNA(Ile)-lysidine synthase